MEDNKVTDTTVQNTVDAGTTTTTTETTQTKKSFNELLASDKEYQSAFDKQKSDSIRTALEHAKEQWEKDNQAKRIEAEKLAQMDEDHKKEYAIQQEKQRADNAEKQLNAYKLKDETVRQAQEKGISLGLLDAIDFAQESAESISKKLDIFEKNIKAEREKAINQYSKEPPPQTGDKATIDSNISGYEKFLKNIK